MDVVDVGMEMRLTILELGFAPIEEEFVPSAVQSRRYNDLPILAGIRCQPRKNEEEK